MWNGTLVYLGVENEDELVRWTMKLDGRNIGYTTFREPDLGDQLTSLATIVENERVFSKLKLLFT